MSDIAVPLATLDKVAFLDPASGKTQTRRQSARSAIGVIGQDDQQRVFVLYAWAGRVPVPGLVEKMFEVNKLFKPRVFGGEADALQILFQEAVRMIAHDRNEQLPLLPVQHSTKIEKDFRIRTTLQPVIAEGRLILQESQHELLAELEGFPAYPTKDLVDMLASAIDLLPNKPMQKERDSNNEALATYLRKTGAPAWYIERKCGETALSRNPIQAMLWARAQGRTLRRPIPET